MKRRPPATCVVFDLDGTLVDSAPDLCAAANDMLRAHALPPLALETLRGFVGNGVPTLVSRCFAHHGAAASDAAGALALFRERYAATRHRHSTVFEGVYEAMSTLREAGSRLAVCTNKDEDAARDLLEAKGLMPLVEAVVGGDTLEVRKPDPAPLRRCAEVLDMPPHTLVFVGDSAVDADTARRAGVPMVLHEHGYGAHECQPGDWCATFGRFRKLPDLIAALRAGAPLPAG